MNIAFIVLLSSLVISEDIPLKIIHTTDSMHIVYFYFSLTLHLVHGWIYGHSHNTTYNGTLRDLYDFVNYYKTAAAPDELVLLFDTGDLVEVCLFIHFAVSSSFH